MTQKPEAIIFWDANSWHIALVATKAALPGDFQSLDDAILAAHSLDMRVAAVTMTRGTIKEPCK